MTRLAVVLFNLGGPDSLEAVRPFLFNLFRDPAIIDLRHAITSRPPYRRLPGLNVSRFTRQLKAYFKRSSLASLRHIINPKYGYEFRSGNVSGYNYNYTKVVFYLKG